MCDWTVRPGVLLLVLVEGVSVWVFHLWLALATAAVAAATTTAATPAPSDDRAEDEHSLQNSISRSA